MHHWPASEAQKAISRPDHAGSNKLCYLPIAISLIGGGDEMNTPRNVAYQFALSKVCPDEVIRDWRTR